MQDEMNERKGSMKTIIVVILLIVAVIALLWATGLVRWEDSSSNGEEYVVANDETSPDSNFSISNREWLELKKEVKQLRMEVEQLKRNNPNSTTTKQRESVPREMAVPQPIHSKPATSNAGEKAISPSPSDITLSNYSHDWVQSDATVALKNNTNLTLIRVSNPVVLICYEEVLKGAFRQCIYCSILLLNPNHCCPIKIK